MVVGSGIGSCVKAYAKPMVTKSDDLRSHFGSSFLHATGAYSALVPRSSDVPAYRIEDSIHHTLLALVLQSLLLLAL